MTVEIRPSSVGHGMGHRAGRVSPLVAWILWPLVLVATDGLAGDAPAGRASHSLDEVRSILEAKRQKLRSLEATLSCWFEENIGTRRCEHFVVAAKANRRYAQLWHGEYGGASTDPGSVIRIYDGENWIGFKEYFLRYDVSKKFAIPPYTNKILCHPLFESLAWWPPDDPTPPLRIDNAKIFTCDVLKDERCRVVDRRWLGDAWCHVVEIPGETRLWVDCERGVVVRRDMYKGMHTDQTFAVFESSDFRPVGEGVYLPYSIRRTVTRSPRLNNLIVVKDYKINSVEDSRFHIDIPSGTLIRDRDTDQFYQVPGGFGIMERVARFASAEARSKSPGPGRLVALYSAYSVIGVVFGFLLYCLTDTVRAAMRPKPIDRRAS
jgi:hypothetical protein